MKILLAALACFTFLVAHSQNHEENLRTIKTIEEAKLYAADFREVSFGMVNAEKDVMFFDDIDTSNLESYVGATKTFYGRSTKMIEDTLLSMVSIQVITFDLSKISKETAEILRSQMIKKLEEGETYWFLKSKFGHTSAVFESSPEVSETVVNKFNIEESQFEKGKYYTWEIVGSKDQIGILIVSKLPHQVPGFITISYLNLN